MGFLTDSTPPNKNWVFCQDLYPFRIIVEPGFANNLTLQSIIKDEIPDVEEWQFAGRRYCPPARKGKPLSPKLNLRYAQNSRRVRPRDEFVVFGFHTTLQRDQVAARLTAEGYKYTYQDEPAAPLGDGEIILLV